MLFNDKSVLLCTQNHKTCQIVVDEASKTALRMFATKLFKLDLNFGKEKPIISKIINEKELITFSELTNLANQIRKTKNFTSMLDVCFF